MAEGTRLLSEYGGQTPSRVRIPPSPCLIKVRTVMPESRRGGKDCIAACDHRVCQIAIPCDRDEPGVFNADRGREMNGVVPAQAVKLGEFACELRQRAIDANHAQLGIKIVNRADRTAQRVCVDPPHPAGQRRRRARLWVYELAGCCYEAGLVPDLFGEVRSLLGENELDQCGRIEVNDQCRCSATRSDTGSSDWSCRCPVLGRLGWVGSRTSPRARRSASGSSAFTGESRATRLPRIVTTTSPP